MYITKRIVYMIRKKLGLKKGERFQFANQKSETDRYYFTDTAVMKEYSARGKACVRLSSVSLNHLLSDECTIIKCEKLSESK